MCCLICEHNKAQTADAGTLNNKMQLYLQPTCLSSVNCSWDLWVLLVPSNLIDGVIIQRPMITEAYGV